MKTTLTAKLKLLTTPDQFRALRATQAARRHRYAEVRWSPATSPRL